MAELRPVRRLAFALTLTTICVLLAGCSAAPDSAQSTPSRSTSDSTTDSASEPTAAVAGCPSGIVVSTASELAAAVTSTIAGDVIVLLPGSYVGSFVLTTSGTAEQPITLCGSRDAILDGSGTEDGYTLQLDGASHWVLQGFSITGGQKGLMLDGSSFNTISALSVTGTGDEAVHLRANSTDNLIENSTIGTTGLRTAKYGEGIYVGSAESNWCDITDCEPDYSDNNRIVGNTIANTSAESIDVKEGTSGGEITANVFDGTGMTDADSLLDIKGSNWVISGNTGTASPVDGAQVHAIDEAPGSGNLFSANSFTVGPDGYAINVVGDARELNNRVLCSNIVVDVAATRLSNEDCVAS